MPPMSRPLMTAWATVSNIVFDRAFKFSSAARRLLPAERRWPDRHSATARRLGGRKHSCRRIRTSLFRPAPSPRNRRRHRAWTMLREPFAGREVPPAPEPRLIAILRPTCLMVRTIRMRSLRYDTENSVFAPDDLTLLISGLASVKPAE